VSACVSACVCVCVYVVRADVRVSAWGVCRRACVRACVCGAQDTTARMRAGDDDPSAAPLSRAALEVGVAGLKKLFSLCETSVGRNAGHRAWMAAGGCVPQCSRADPPVGTPLVLHAHCGGACAFPQVWCTGGRCTP
jgi:hypothetical protein